MINGILRCRYRICGGTRYGWLESALPIDHPLASARGGKAKPHQDPILCLGPKVLRLSSPHSVQIDCIQDAVVLSFPSWTFIQSNHWFKIIHATMDFESRFELSTRDHGLQPCHGRSLSTTEIFRVVQTLTHPNPLGNRQMQLPREE